MPIITITSDFGSTDYYLPALKGALLSKNEELRLIDISHNVKKYDIVQGAYILKNAYHTFPKGTLHIVAINAHYSPTPCFLAARVDGHYFVGPDNGIFYLMFGDALKDVYEIELKNQDISLLEKAAVHTVGHIFGEKPFNEIGIPIEDIEQKITILPVISTDQIRGNIIYIDQYENAIVNIDKALFERVGRGRSFQLSYKGHRPITTMSQDYSSVAIGEPLCFFNTAGDLELAINTGQAASLLGLSIDDSVQIDFVD